MKTFSVSCFLSFAFHWISFWRKGFLIGGDFVLLLNFSQYTFESLTCYKGKLPYIPHFSSFFTRNIEFPSFMFAYGKTTIGRYDIEWILYAWEDYVFKSGCISFSRLTIATIKVTTLRWGNSTKVWFHYTYTEWLIMLNHII